MYFLVQVHAGSPNCCRAPGVREPSRHDPVGCFGKLGNYFCPLCDGKCSRGWSLRQQSKPTLWHSPHCASPMGRCFDDSKLSLLRRAQWCLFFPKQSAFVSWVNKNIFPAALQIAKVSRWAAMQFLESISSRFVPPPCLFSHLDMVDSWAGMLSSSSDVFRPSVVTCGLFFCFSFPYLAEGLVQILWSHFCPKKVVWVDVKMLVKWFCISYTT